MPAGAAEALDEGGLASSTWGLDSSRPGADEVSPDEEWRRVRLGLAAVRQADPDVAVSVDTFRSGVVRRAVAEFGPVIVNDISAGELDPDMLRTVAELDLPYIAMHMKGDPKTMQSLTDYRRDIVTEVVGYFRSRLCDMERAGIRRGRIILDPGFGFAKTAAQNFELLAGLHRLCSLGCPVLAGLSRKSMIYRTLGCTPAESLAGTVALGWECLRQGAAILRVHDVREAAAQRAPVPRLPRRYDSNHATMIRVTDIHKSFGSLEVLRGVSLEVADREVVSIVGGQRRGARPRCCRSSARCRVPIRGVSRSTAAIPSPWATATSRASATSGSASSSSSTTCWPSSRPSRTSASPG